jgi:hypothetical protein
MHFKKVIIRACALLMLAMMMPVTAALAQRLNNTDAYRTVLIVDESGSMGQSLDWLGSVLEAAQVSSDALTYDVRPVEFGLVLYTDSARTVSLDGELFNPVSEVAKALKSAGGKGGEEDGYLAIREAINTYRQYSPNGLHLLLFSDEDRDVRDVGESFDSILSDLTDSNAILDVVVNAQFTCKDGRQAVGVTADREGYVLGDDGFEQCEQVEISSIGGDANTSVPDYVILALRLGGTAWQIGAFRHDGVMRVVLKQAGRFPNNIRQQRIEKLEDEIQVLAPAFGEVLRDQALFREPRVLIARARANPLSAAVGDIIMLDAGDSRHVNPAEYIESWSWDFGGDGEEDAWGEVVSTSFDLAGDHVVVLQVLDRNGNAAHARLVVHVE